MKKIYNYIITRPVFAFLMAFFISAPVVVYFSLNIYQSSPNGIWEGILIEAHGMLFDIIILGVLITLINRARERKLEVKRYNEEIDDYRGWESQEASQRIAGIIRRLAKRQKTEGLNLHRCYLQGADLKDINLQKANLKNANLQGAYLMGANLQGAYLVGANLQEANLLGANLRKVDLNHANLQEAQLWITNLQEADLNHANLQKANLLNVNLQGAYLVGANLQGAYLVGANLQEADLLDANLQEVDLNHANLHEANLNLFQIKSAKLDTETIMLDGTKYNEEWHINDSVVPEDYKKKWDLS